MSRAPARRYAGQFRYHPQHRKSQAASYTVRALFEAMETSRITIAEVAVLTDHSRVGVSQWKSGRTTPRIDDLELFARAIGYRLVLAPLILSADDGQQSTSLAD